MRAVVCFYVPVALIGHSGTVGTQTISLGIWGEAEGMPEP